EPGTMNDALFGSGRRFRRPESTVRAERARGRIFRAANRICKGARSMSRKWLTALCKYVITTCFGLACGTGAIRADEKDAALRAQLEQQSKQLEVQSKQIEELRKRLDAAEAAKAANAGVQGAALSQPANVDDNAVKAIVADYLKEVDKKKKDDEKKAKDTA